MKIVPAPRSCAAAAHPASAHLLFPLIALALLLFAWPDPADAKRMVGAEAFGSKTSYHSGRSKPTPGANDSPAMAQQAAPNDQPRFGGLGVMFDGLPMVDKRNIMDRACQDELTRQPKLEQSFKMKRERQAKRTHV